MGIVNRIKLFMAEKERINGFGWAMAAFYIEGESLFNIQNFCDIARTMGEYTAFDAGAEEAIAIIKKHNRATSEK